MIKTKRNRIAKPEFDEIISSVEQEIESVKSLTDEAQEIHMLTIQLQKERKAVESSFDVMLEVHEQLKEYSSEFTLSRMYIEKAVKAITKAINKAQRTEIEVNISEAGKKQLDERNNAAVSAISATLEAHEKRLQTIIRRQENSLEHIPLPQTICYILITTITLLLMAFAGLVVLNLYRLHSPTLTSYLWIVGAALIGFNSIIAVAMWWMRR